MATIEKRGNRYRARIRINGTDKSATFDKHSDASEWIRMIESKLQDGKHGISHKYILFGDLIEKYLKEITPTKRGARSERYRLLRILKTDLANINISNLTPKDFANYRDMRLLEVSSSTVLKEIGVLSAICNLAMKEWGLLSDNPVLKISKPKEPSARNRRPTDKEIEQICTALGYSENVSVSTISQRIACIVLFAIETAMRSGEICSLTWNRVNLNRRIAHLDKTKNGNARDVPLSKRAIEILEKVKGIDEYSVFNVDDGTRDTLFRRARDDMQINDLHFHDLRREALTRMSKKVPVEVLAKISGHKDIRILMNVYYNPDISELASLLD